VPCYALNNKTPIMKVTRTINRRAFLISTTLAAGGLLVGFNVPAGGKKKHLPEGEKMLVPNAFLRVGEDDSVTVILSHCEMGQGIWTALCMLIAEELDADWKMIRAEHAPAAVAYYHTMYGTQRTGGSSSLMSEFDRYRNAGATARQLLIQAAASRLNVPVNECHTENGYVIAKDKKIRYGELVSTAVTLTAPAEVKLKDPASWKFIGQKKIRRLDTPDKITGKAIFGMDIQLPGMLIAMIARPPVPGAKVKSIDAKAAMAIPGVKQVIQVPQGVAVLAEDTWIASKGRQALQIEWDTSAGASLSSDALLAEMKKRADSGGLVATNAGNLDEAFRKSVKVVEAEYYQPFLAHAPMEPLNCTVKLSDDKCEIWTGTQTQTDDQRAAAEITGLPVEKVFINTVMLGGSFGRRNITRSDFVREAVEVAKASGKLVKVVWTREDDIQGGMYRPAFLHRFKVGLDQSGMPIAWKQVSVGQSVMKGGPFEKVAVINGIDMFSIEAMQTAPHVKAIPHQRIELNTPEWPVQIDNWRAVGLSHTIFAMESLADEMARAAGKDPVAYRRQLYKAEPRLVKVLDLAAEKSGWAQKLSPGKGRGVAVYEAVSSFVAVVVEVTTARNGAVKIDKVTCAVDCGIPINPDGIIAQTEGSLAFGLSTALYSEITLKEGKVQQKNFYNYPVLRINEMPRIEVFIVPGTDKPGGIGEASVGQVMPALTNAIFAATGKRIRNLPIKHIA
jgi:isoquinoline 1-oxidoreductase beta subunit